MSLKRFIQQSHFYIIKKTITHYNETLKHGKLFHFCFEVSSISITHAYTQPHQQTNTLTHTYASIPGTITARKILVIEQEWIKPRQI